MNEYKITLTENYEKTFIVNAKTAAHAREKVETILFDTDLISFDDDDFIGVDVDISNVSEQECNEDLDKILNEIVESLALSVRQKFDDYELCNTDIE